MVNSERARARAGRPRRPRAGGREGHPRLRPDRRGARSRADRCLGGQPLQQLRRLRAPARAARDAGVPANRTRLTAALPRFPSSTAAARRARRKLRVEPRAGHPAARRAAPGRRRGVASSAASGHGRGRPRPRVPVGSARARRARAGALPAAASTGDPLRRPAGAGRQSSEESEGAQDSRAANSAPHDDCWAGTSSAAGGSSSR